MNHDRISTVGAIKLQSYDSIEDIRNGVYGLMDQFNQLIPKLENAQVLMKINLCLLLGPETGATTDPRVVQALVEWIVEKRPVREIILAESDATHMSADIAYRALGWEKIFKNMTKVRFLNLSKDKLISVQSERTYIKDLKMSKTYMTCDWLVDVAKLKTHTEQKITCCLKNIFGAIPRKVKFVFHPRLTEAICDANSPRIPDFGFIDGLIATENDGPTKGTPRPTGLLMAGNDIVSLDHYASKTMGFNPRNVPHIQLAIKRKMGEEKYRILNPSIKPCRPSFSFMPFWKQAIRSGVKKVRKN